MKPADTLVLNRETRVLAPTLSGNLCTSLLHLLGIGVSGDE